MAQILVRNLDDDLVKALKKQAEASGRSLQAESKRILEQGLRLEHANARNRILEIQQQLKGKKFLDSTALIREDRDR